MRKLPEQSVREGNGKDLSGDDKQTDDEDYPGSDNTEDAPRLPLLSPLYVLGEHGNDRGRDRSARDHVVDDVGDRKGGPIDVRFRALAELVGDDAVAHQP